MRQGWLFALFVVLVIVATLLVFSDEGTVTYHSNAQVMGRVPQEVGEVRRAW